LPQTACDLELWQEAFRSVEDIQGLMALGKKTPKPQLMAIYYARLTRIFTVSDSHLYNGYAWCADALNLQNSSVKGVVVHALKIGRCGAVRHGQCMQVCYSMQHPRMLE